MPPSRAAAFTAVLAWTLAASSARADGYNARFFRPATGPDGIGTIESARAPETGSMVFALGTDFVAGPMKLVGSNDSRATVDARWVTEPSLHIGLGARFGLWARLPIATYDQTSDALGSSPPVGLMPTAFGLLVPLYRDPFTDSRFALRAELELPLGDAVAFRGNGDVVGSLALVYSGQIGAVATAASLGGHLMPTRVTGNAGTGTSALAGVGLRWPAKSPFAVTLAVNSRLQIGAPNDGSGLASGGFDLRFGQRVSLRATGGALVGILQGANGWAGLAFGVDVPLFSTPVAEPPPNDPPAGPPSP